MTFLKLFTILNFLLSSFLSFKCGTGKIKPPKIQIQPEDKTQKNLKNRNLSSHPINIYIDYEIIENQTMYINELKEAFNITIKTFQKFLSISSSSKFKFTELQINSAHAEFTGDDVPYLLANSESIGADLYIIPTISAVNTNIDASAFPIVLNNNDHRPILGGIYLSSKFNFFKKNDMTYMTSLLLHEMSHILGFNFDLFPYFKNMKILKTIINGKKRLLLSSPNVLKYAKGHFGCENLPGVELENQGGQNSAGSHWESRIMMGDYMIAQDYPEIVVSDITLAVFEDSGWYNVNYYSGGLFKTGKGEGCKFLINDCIDKKTHLSNFKLDFCDTKKKEVCSPSLIDRGSCYLVDYNQDDDFKIDKEYQYFGNNYTGGWIFADFCPVMENHFEKYYHYYSRCDDKGMSNLPNELGEILSDNSFCFISTLVNSNSNDEIKNKYSYEKAICYKVENCDINTFSYTINIGDKNFTCQNVRESKSFSVDGFDGKINCPPYFRICGGSILCNDLFDCAEKKSVTSIVNTNSFVKNDISYPESNIEEEIISKIIKDSVSNHGKFLKISYFLIFGILVL